MQNIAPEKVHETLGKYIIVDGFPVVFDAEKSHGSYMYDSRTNSEYLDLFSFFASMPVGYNHAKMQDPAFKERLGYLATFNPTNSDIYSVEYASFVDSFAQHAGQPYFSHYFFVAGGGLAVENTIKAACDWKVRKLGKATSKDVTDMQVIHFTKAFHGRTGYTMTVTNTNDPNKYLYFPKFEWPRIDHPTVTFPLNDTNRAAVEKLEQQALEQINQAVSKNGDRIAAMIIEPIQGEGGDNHVRSEFLKALRKIADDNAIMLVFDEVQTGFGLTGKMWCFENYDCVPDMIAFGKKTQVCGIATTKRIDEAEGNVFETSSRINSTWGGNLVDMMRCERYLQIIKEDNLVDNARQVGEETLGMLNAIQESYPKVISNTRGRGLMIAFDLPNEDARNKFIGEVYNRKMIVMPSGEKSVRLRPHLDIEAATMKTAIDAFGDVAKSMA